MSKKALTTILALLLACLVLASCGTSTDGAYSDDGQQEDYGLEAASEADSTDNTANNDASAYEAAKEQLSLLPYSRRGLIDELVHEGYPEDIAEEAVSQVEESEDVDWTEQAVKTAQNYLNYIDEGLTSEELFNALTEDERYTEEESRIAINEVFN